MIRLLDEPDTVVLVSDEATTEDAFVDADWISRREAGPVPAIEVDALGRLTFCGGPPVEPPPGLSPEAGAEQALLAVAREAATVARERCTSGAVDVVGAGYVARAARSFLEGVLRADEGDPSAPEVIVDTTGDGGVLSDATRRLGNLGTLVIAGEQSGRLDLDLYVDVHRRGLTLVGVAPPLSGGYEAWERVTRPKGFDGEPPMVIRAGESVPSGGLWYRLERSDRPSRNRAPGSE